MVDPITENPPTQGQQPWFATRDAFDQAVKATVNELAASMPNVLLLAENEELPIGLPSGVLIVRVPDEAVPLTDLETSNGVFSSTAPLTAKLPTNRAIGDTVFTAIVSTGSHTNFVWPAGWVDVDYSANQSLKVAVGMYSISDQTALDALGNTVDIFSGSTNVVTGLVIAWVGADTAPAPTYGSGTNRSAATITSQTTSGGTIGQIGTVTAAPIKDVYVFVGNRSTTTDPDNGVDLTSASVLIAQEHLVVDTISLNLTVRKLTTPPSVAPIPAQPFTTAHTNSDAMYGGGTIVVAGR